MGLLDSLYVGASGLAAASAGIDATAQNVANASTPGYTRRSVQQSVADPIRHGIVQIGQGVEVTAITRDSANLLGMQRIEAGGDASAAAAFYDALAEVEILFDETMSDGMRSDLDTFFDALTAATADPSDAGLRGAVLDAAEDLARGVADTAAQLDAAQARFEQDIEISLPPLNAKLQEVALLNQRLVSAGGADAAPDIADQLDRLLRELGDEAGFTSKIEADGTATVMLGGHAVVEGTEAREISYSAPTGVSIEVDNGYVTVQPGGRLGGVAQAHAAVDGYRADLNTFAADLADAVNAVHTAGFDANGAPGVALFTYDPADPAGSLAIAAGLDADSLAFAGATPAAAGDADNLKALLALEDAAVVGGKTPGAALSALTNDVASDVARASADAQRAGLVAQDLDTLAANLHGVDMDEEAMKLITFQTAYQAAAKVIQVTDELLGTLMELT